MEHLIHKLKHSLSGGSFGKLIFDKMVNELALMGIVSFVAITFSNIHPWFRCGSSWRFLMLEITHIMVFVMAIMFCILIGLVNKTARAPTSALTPPLNLAP